MNAEDIADHAQGVAHGAHFAIRIEIPADRYFVNAKFFTTGQVEQLDIEGPTGKGLFSEEDFSRFGAEAFEAALGVVQPRQDQGADDEVDSAPANMTIGWLIVANSPRCFTRTDGNVEVIDRWRQELAQVFDGHGKVGITDETVFAARSQHSAPNGVAFAFVMFLNDHKVGMLFDELHGAFECAICAAILHNNDFACVRLTLKK